MTAQEKLTVANLLLAIEAEAKTHSIGFTIALPPKPGEWEQRQQEIDAIRAKEQAKLAAAITAARNLLGEGA